MWFKKKEKIPSWMDQMDFRFNRIASHYDPDQGWVYLTEPVLQFRRDWNSDWQAVPTHIEQMPAAETSKTAKK